MCIRDSPILQDSWRFREIPCLNKQSLRLYQHSEIRQTERCTTAALLKLSCQWMHGSTHWHRSVRYTWWRRSLAGSHQRVVHEYIWISTHEKKHNRLIRLFYFLTTLTLLIFFSKIQNLEKIYVCKDFILNKAVSFLWLRHLYVINKGYIVTDALLSSTKVSGCHIQESLALAIMVQDDPTAICTVSIAESLSAEHPSAVAARWSQCTVKWITIWNIN